MQIGLVLACDLFCTSVREFTNSSGDSEERLHGATARMLQKASACKRKIQVLLGLERRLERFPEVLGGDDPRDTCDATSPSACAGRHT